MPTLMGAEAAPRSCCPSPHEREDYSRKGASAMMDVDADHKPLATRPAFSLESSESRAQSMSDPDEYTERFIEAVHSKLSQLETELVEEYTRVSELRQQQLMLENATLRVKVEMLKKGGFSEQGTKKDSGEEIEDVAEASQEPLRRPSTPANFVAVKLDPEPAEPVEHVTAASLGMKYYLHDELKEFYHISARKASQYTSFKPLVHHFAKEEGSNHPWYIVNPTGTLKLGWDVVGIPVLGWDLITIPMSVFGIAETPAMESMGWVTLLYWSLDIPFCFITGYWDHLGVIVTELALIARHYLRGMFVLDIIIIGSDWLSVFLELATTGGSPGWVKHVSILRALRITRFARLLRLRKLKAKWQTVEDHISDEWTLVCLNLVGKIFTILCMTHYIACAWFFLGDVSIHGYQTWLDTPYPMFRPKTTLLHTAWGYQYWTALHWALCIFTPGGMHVTPQNIPERIFTIVCLLFGMVVFSSFVAAVTQARLHLNKMMSKFERDLWLLRKYCRQNQISSQLTIRMKRYVDLVLIPQFQTMSEEDVSILSKLSKHLREELTTEKNCHIICVHPFFEQLQHNKAAISKICNADLTHVSVAHGDVIFSAGQVAGWMLWITSGTLDYIPHGQEENIEQVGRGKWLCEAALWSTWVTQGQLQGAEESSGVELDAVRFRNTMRDNPMFASYARKYAHAFLAELNNTSKDAVILPSDNQEQVTLTLMKQDFFKLHSINSVETAKDLGRVKAPKNSDEGSDREEISDVERTLDAKETKVGAKEEMKNVKLL